MTLRALFFLALLVPAAPAAAQDESPPDTYAEDIASVDAVIAALYEVISGPAHEPRDWARFRYLLTPDGRFLPIRRSPDGTHAHRSMTAQDFIDTAGAYLDSNSFYETEVARTTERYGNLVHAFSTYDSFHTLEDEAPFQRGINSIQLLRENDRWWIANVAWQPAWPDLPIPAEYEGGER